MLIWIIEGNTVNFTIVSTLCQLIYNKSKLIRFSRTYLIFVICWYARKSINRMISNGFSMHHPPQVRRCLNEVIILKIPVALLNNENNLLFCTYCNNNYILYCCFTLVISEQNQWYQVLRCGLLENTVIDLFILPICQPLVLAPSHPITVMCPEEL